MSASKKNKGLGKGLELLLGPSVSITEPVSGEVIQQIKVTQIQAGKYQPRSKMDEVALNELAESINKHGLMQPILVRSIAKEQYEIIAGERRFRASIIAGFKEVPVIVRQIPDESALVMALIENIQREDLSALEEAQGIQRLIKEFGLTHEQAAQAVGKSRSAISNLLRLLSLPAAIQTMLVAGDLEMGHARALLPLSAAQQITAAHEVVNRQLSVRETEKLVAIRLAVKNIAKLNKVKLKENTSADIVKLEEQLSDAIAANVKIKSTKKGNGMLSIHFNSLDELDGILERIGLLQTS
jgi:ParB family chromosome partitioning protein